MIQVDVGNLQHIVLNDDSKLFVVGKGACLKRYHAETGLREWESVNEYKVSSMLICNNRYLYLHDVGRKCMTVINLTDMSVIHMFKGYTIAEYIECDSVLIGNQLVWYMGGRSLGLIDTTTNTSLKKMRYFTSNMIVRKMIARNPENPDQVQVVTLETFDVNNKNLSFIHAFDVQMNKRICMGRCHVELNTSSVKDNTIYRYTKSIEMFDEDTIISVGVYVQILPTKQVQKGFINAMKLSDNLEEISIKLVENTGLNSSKGLYRITKFSKNRYITTGWSDMHIIDYKNSTFVQVSILSNLHNTFIYNVVMLRGELYTCSNDLKVAKIRLNQ